MLSQITRLEYGSIKDKRGVIVRVVKNIGMLQSRRFYSVTSLLLCMGMIRLQSEEYEA